jgi:hypothetical protein
MNPSDSSHCHCWWDTGGDAPEPLMPCCYCGFNGADEEPCEPPKIVAALLAAEERGREAPRVEGQRTGQHHPHGCAVGRCWLQG